MVERSVNILHQRMKTINKMNPNKMMGLLEQKTSIPAT